jgi:hypothetical protein
MPRPPRGREPAEPASWTPTSPTVASQLSDCFGAGTGCQWCVPFLKKIHAQWSSGESPDLPVSPETYAARRASYRSLGVRDADAEQGQ